MADPESGRSGDTGTQEVNEDQGGEEIYRHPMTLGKLLSFSHYVAFKKFWYLKKMSIVDLAMWWALDKW